MFQLGTEHRYYLYRNRCDMRKSFDGLCGIVSNELQRSPMPSRNSSSQLPWCELRTADGLTLCFHQHLSADFCCVMQQTDASSIDYKKLYDQQIVVYEDLSCQLAAHNERVSFLSAEIAKLRKMIFGTHVERFVPAEGFKNYKVIGKRSINSTI